MATKKETDDELAAVRKQLDQLLDIVTTQEDTIATLKMAQQSNDGATVVRQSEAEAALDAELEALKAEFKDWGRMDVFERRVLEGIDASVDIRLQGDVPVTDDPTGERRYWHLRWFNLGKEGRAQQAAAEAYERVEWAELLDQDSVSTGDRTKPHVCRGERGLEVLYKIPRKLFVYKKKRDAARAQGLLQSETQLRDHLANSVAARAGLLGMNGDQAGTFVNGGMTMEITPQPKETMTF